MAGAELSDHPAASWRWRADLLLVGSALFLVLTTAAMVVFPGEVIGEVAADHYLFFGNFLSDLGSSHPYAAQSNTASQRLFGAALIAIGIALGQFGAACTTWAGRRRTAMVPGVICAVAAAASGACFIGIALTPWDENFEVHIAYVYAAFGLLATFVAAFALVQAQNCAPRKWIGANLVHLVALAAYGVLLAKFPTRRSGTGMGMQVAAQKAIVYASILNLSAQAWAVRSQTKNATPRSVSATEPAPRLPQTHG